MTKAEALYKFFNGFGLDAYPDTNVPEDAELPYLTYNITLGSIGYQISMPVNLWYRTESEAVPMAKVEQISKAIGSGTYVQCDGGAILITKGSPFCQSLMDDTEEKIKRKYLNLVVEYLTNN